MHGYVFFLNKLRKVITYHGKKGVILTIRGRVRFIPLEHIKKRPVFIPNLPSTLNRDRLQHWMSILFRKPSRTWDPRKLLREEGYPLLNIFWLEDLLETWLVGNLQPLRNILIRSEKVNPVGAAVISDYYHITQAGLKIKFPNKATYRLYRGVPARGVIRLIKRGMTVPPARSYTTRYGIARDFCELEDRSGIVPGGVIRINAPVESIFHSDDVFPLVKLTGDSVSEKEYIVLNALPAKLAFKPTTFKWADKPHIQVSLRNVPFSQWSEMYKKLVSMSRSVKLYGKAYMVREGKVMILNDEDFNWLSIVRDLRKKGYLKRFTK